MGQNNYVARKQNNSLAYFPDYYKTNHPSFEFYNHYHMQNMNIHQNHNKCVSIAFAPKLYPLVPESYPHSQGAARQVCHFIGSPSYIAKKYLYISAVD